MPQGLVCNACTPPETGRLTRARPLPLLPKQQVHRVLGFRGTLSPSLGKPAPQEQARHPCRPSPHAHAHKIVTTLHFRSSSTIAEAPRDCLEESLRTVAKHERLRTETASPGSDNSKCSVRDATDAFLNASQAWELLRASCHALNGLSSKWSFLPGLLAAQGSGFQRPGRGSFCHAQ